MSFRVSWSLVCDGGMHRSLPRDRGCLISAGPSEPGKIDTAERVLAKRAAQAGWKTMRSGRTGEIHLCPMCAELNRI